VIVLIDGEGASGKTVLRSLLDGHPQLSVLPTHDMIVDTLVGYPPDVPWLAYRDIGYLRRLLAASSYYQLEQLAVAGSIEIDISVRDRLTVPYRLDFWRFEAEWVRALAGFPQWTVGGVVEAIHSAYVRIWEGRPRDVVGHVGVGFDAPGTAARLFQHAPEAKLIYLHRPTEGILAARARRRSSARDMFSKINDELTVDVLLRKDKVRKIRDRFGAVQRLARLRPDRVRIVEFDELVENTAVVARDIAGFLGIEPTDGLRVPTLAGQPLRSAGGDSYVGRVLDRPEDLLSRTERALIQIDTDWRAALDPALLREPGLVGRAVGIRLGRLLDRARATLRARL
jgi:hypothetical protein